MKSINAKNRIEKQFEKEMNVEKRGFNNVYSIEVFGYTLSFIDCNGDAENLYLVKTGSDNGYNGYNGIFPKNLQTAFNIISR